MAPILYIIYNKLHIIYNKLLQSSEIPNVWRKAHATPIYNKGQRYKAENYRLVSFTCMRCKACSYQSYTHDIAKDPMKLNY